MVHRDWINHITEVYSNGNRLIIKMSAMSIYCKIFHKSSSLEPEAESLYIALSSGGLSDLFK